jgi:nicotinate-nucleotide pyrophosphorylase
MKDNHLKTLEKMCEQLQRARLKDKDLEVERNVVENDSLDEMERLLRKKYETQIG